jgi:hypothetical protein
VFHQHPLKSFRYAINAILSAMGHTMRLLVRWISPLLLALIATWRCQSTKPTQPESQPSAS